MADVDYVNSLYLSVLARDPDPDGANAWVNQITGGATYDQVRAAFINSSEAQTIVSPIVRLYEGLLGRTPDGAGLEAWSDALRGGASLNSVTEAFLTSQEAIDNGFLANLSNAAFVTKLYESMGRDPDTAGLDGWVASLDGSMTKAQVAQAFMESAENLQHSNDFVTGYLTLRSHGSLEPTTADINGFIADQDFVEGLYRTVLAREPDADGVTAWTSQLSGGATHAQVTAAFLESGEAQSLVNPIVRLYEGLLNRAPDAGGLDAWADVLRGGASLSDVTAAFLNSDEAIANGFAANLSNQAFVTKLYESMGREPDSAGLDGWVAALDGGMTKAQVAQAFMESAENQQNADGFVTGWGALRAAGNPGPTTAQLDNFSDTATTAEIIASADAVGTSTTTFPAGAGAAPYNLSDAAANLMATDPRLLNGATTITATDPVTINQLAAIDAITTGTLTAALLTDTAANLAADAATNAGAGTYVTGATNVTVDGIATLDQLAEIDEATTGTLTYTAVTGSAAALAASDYVTGATNVTVDGIATLDQLAEIDEATTGTLTYTAVTGSAAALAAAPALLNGATDITATDAATVAQATTIDNASNTGTTTYNIHDTGAALGGAGAAVLNHATNIIASGPVTVSQAGIIEAATNAGTNTYNISDTPSSLANSTDAVLSLAGTVTASVAATAAEAVALAAFAKPVVYNVSDAAANLVGHSGAALNEAVALTATDDATVAQATTIDAATNTGATTYDINDTGANLALAIPAVLDHATGIDAIGDAVTLTDTQVTGGIIGKFDSADRLTLNAALGTTLSNLSATTLEDARVLSLNAVDNAVTLTEAQVTDVIVGKFDPTDNLTLHASGERVAALSATTLADADVIHINVTGDNQVALYDDAGHHRITNEIIAKFDATDRLELNAENGATLAALDAATLSSDKVARLDAINDQVTLTDGQVTSAIIEKFVDTDEDPDVLTLNAPGAAFDDLGRATMYHPSMILHSTLGPVQLTAAQFDVLSIDETTTTIAETDDIRITDDESAYALNLHSAGGDGVTLVFNQLYDPVGADIISGFIVDTDTLEFSLAAFSTVSGLGVIDANEFLATAEVSGSGTEGDANTRFLYNNGGGENAGDLFYDADGSGAGEAVLIANMQTVPALGLDDIIMA